jgi:N-acetylglutamate synthase-like GNAT family acetyltransferase
MTDVTIRKMREVDRVSVIAILARWNMAPVPLSPNVPDSERLDLAADGTAIVAVVGDRIVGVASYVLHSGRRAETASLAVDPAWRGTGVGAKLQLARLAELKARGVEEIFTETDRPDVIDWYIRKFGYRIVGTRRKKHDFSLRDVDHWTILELDLRDWMPEG